MGAGSIASTLLSLNKNNFYWCVEYPGGEYSPLSRHMDTITALFGIDAVLAVAITTALVKLFTTDVGKEIIELKSKYDALRGKVESYIEMGKDGYDAQEISAIREDLRTLLNRG